MGKDEGIVRSVDELGRVVLPAEIRRSLGLGHTDPVAFYVDEQQIVVRKYEPTCVLCGASAAEHFFRKKPVCTDCVAEARRTYKTEY